MPHDPDTAPAFVEVTLRLPARGTPEQYAQALQKEAENLISQRAGAGAAALLRVGGLVRVAMQLGQVARHPDAFALVPVEPSQSMCETGSRAWLEGSLAGNRKPHANRYARSCARVWRAMVAEAMRARQTEPSTGRQEAQS